jgi:predicted amidohydrolase YtcJ
MPQTFAPTLRRLRCARVAAIAAGLVASLVQTAAQAQPAELIVVRARIATLDAASTTASALAVRDGRLIAVGSDAAVQATAGPATRRVDAGGRTLIPGLIDSHMHAIRAALSYATEVNWIDAPSIDEAMRRLRDAAGRARPGAWLIVAGGWTEQQFREKRRPTQA